MDLVFVLDGSGSICDKDSTAEPNNGCNNWKLVIEFIQTLISNFVIGDDSVRVGFVIFANNGNLKFGLDE